MSYEFYKVLHLTGLIMLFLSLGALAYVPRDKRRPMMIVHGIGLVLMLVAGFGILAKLGIGMKPWVHVKLAVWVILALVPTYIRLKPGKPLLTSIVVILLGALASYFAIAKSGF